MKSSSDRCKDKKDEEFTLCTRLYRIIPFQRLAEILIFRRNSLVHPSKWTDPFEKWRIDKISETCTESKSSDKKYFGQCWTLEPTKDEMWTIYSQGTDGVRIRTTVGRLIDPLNNNGIRCIASKVKYLEREKILWYFGDDRLDKDKVASKIKTYFNKNSRPLPADMHMSRNFLKMAEKFMIKRIGFSYEHEARLICLGEKSKSDEYYRYRMCPNSMIDQIKIHPRVSWREYKALKCTIKRLGFDNEIGRSELHDMVQRKIARKVD